MRRDLALVPVDEGGIDGDETEPAGHGQRGEQACLAETNHRHVHGAADLQQSGLLEMADDERVIAGTFCFQCVANGLRGATEFAQRMKVAVRWIETVHFKADIRSRSLIKKRLQSLDVRLLLDRMDEALVPNLFCTGWFGHLQFPDDFSDRLL